MLLARHATISNNRSIGVEIAQMGAYGKADDPTLAKWYRKSAGGQTVLTPPKPFDQMGVKTPRFQGVCDRAELIVDDIQKTKLHQHDFTPQQYDSLIKLTATLCTVFPRMKCDYPKDAKGDLIPYKLTEAQWKNFHGVLGHYHVQLNKTDPGPAFNWEKVIGGAKALMETEVAAKK